MLVGINVMLTTLQDPHNQSFPKKTIYMLVTNESR